MKDGLQTIPMYGFYFYQHACVYVNRDAFRPQKMLEALDYLKHPKIRSWVVIFPEGTLFDPVDIPTIEKSRKIAEEKKLPVLGNHLTPRYRGAYMIFDRLKEKLDAVYNVTYVYDNSMTDEGRKTAPQLIGE
ncbi:1-acyl-sn-glycerol-3-phosphate acyltransferase epsilon-like [Artemia franciscana]|uniref:1-acyl-sn-glycerol-3-phosphate acyltransferase epsilon-like n=1 Tax=Artemia franciscana TaxID=6661 RepID=UPI0032DB8AAC